MHYVFKSARAGVAISPDHRFKQRRLGRVGGHFHREIIQRDDSLSEDCNKV